MKTMIKKLLAPIFRKYDVLIERNKQETDALYKLLYNQVHDLDQALPLASNQTANAFDFQWSELSDGEAMLSDKWFKDNVKDIITNRETQINAEWFKGKEVIDCGCGGGRWSYGLAQLGANITAVDINQSAIDATREVLQPINNVQKNFINAPLESLSTFTPAGKKYDMVWSWGVLHHCGSFTKAFHEVMSLVKEGGIIYIYLYGRESIPYDEDISLFKNRVYYNTLTTWDEKKKFLLLKSNGDETKLHQNHDIYAPLLNRRLGFDQVKKMLEDNGFTDVTRTVKHTELHIRAVKGKINPAEKGMLLYSENNLPWASKYNN